MKKTKKKQGRGETMVRVFAMQTVAQVLALAINTARVADDDDLIASLERVDALHYHEAKNFLGLPLGARKRRR
jgi:cyanophycinase-like exopeptidase